jgi:antitoxin ParD1/3/4
MTVELRPELEDLVRQDLRAGVYGSVEEYVEKAVMLLHNQESWLLAHREEVAAQIEAGWQAAERGDVIDADRLRAELQHRKTA